MASRNHQPLYLFHFTPPNTMVLNIAYYYNTNVSASKYEAFF